MHRPDFAEECQVPFNASPERFCGKRSLARQNTPVRLDGYESETGDLNSQWKKQMINVHSVQYDLNFA